VSKAVGMSLAAGMPLVAGDVFLVDARIVA